MIDPHSVKIIMYNLSGLYMGPVAQIASMLVYPINDNSKTSKIIESALTLMSSNMSKKKSKNSQDNKTSQSLREKDKGAASSKSLSENAEDVTLTSVDNKKPSFLKLITDTTE